MLSPFWMSLEFLFFSLCASSITQTLQLTRLRNSTSVTTISNVVIKASSFTRFLRHDYKSRYFQALMETSYLIPLTMLLVIEDFIVLEDLPGVSRSMIDDCIHVCPSLELSNPILNRRQRNHDQERSMNAILVDLMKEGDRLELGIFSKFRELNYLNCLSETHFICENAILLIIIAVQEPVDTFELVFPKF